MESKVMEKMSESINKIIDEGLNTSNVELLYKLMDIYKDAKEVESMNYGNYSGRGPGYETYGISSYGNYGNYDMEYGRGSYGRQGRDSRYRGDEYIDRMHNEYGRYMESRNRYGAGEESDKAFHFMTKALGEYIEFLYETAETPQQKQQLQQALQNSMR